MADLEIPIEAYDCLDYMPRGFHKAVRIAIAAELRRLLEQENTGDGWISLSELVFERANELDPPCGS